MVELLGYLRANGFRTFIVSGGGVEFMRPWVETVYGIPPEQVIGSSGEVQLRFGKDGKPEVFEVAKVEFIDDGPGKPVGINRFIGRRQGRSHQRQRPGRDVVSRYSAGTRLSCYAG